MWELVQNGGPSHAVSNQVMVLSGKEEQMKWYE